MQRPHTPTAINSRLREEFRSTKSAKDEVILRTYSAANARTSEEDKLHPGATPLPTSKAASKASLEKTSKCKSSIVSRPLG